jgi:hypothetical protein
MREKKKKRKALEFVRVRKKPIKNIFSTTTTTKTNISQINTKKRKF